MNSPKAPYQPRAKLMARIEEKFPFACPSYGGDIRLIAFITEPGPIRKILTHLGEFPELRDDERAGLLHVPGDPADLAHAITAILDDASLAARLGGHGHALARERCSAAGMAAEHESLYRSLTGFDARPSASRGRV